MNHRDSRQDPSLAINSLALIDTSYYVVWSCSLFSQWDGDHHVSPAAARCTGVQAVEMRHLPRSLRHPVPLERVPWLGVHTGQGTAADRPTSDLGPVLSRPSLDHPWTKLGKQATHQDGFSLVPASAPGAQRQGVSATCHHRGLDSVPC